MNRLINAGFYALLRDRLFRISMIIMAAAGVALPLYRLYEVKRSGEPEMAETVLFLYAPLIAITIWGVCSSLVGDGYADGTVRNKIISGNTRFSIYLSNLLVSFVASLMMQAAYLIPALALGLPILGTEMGIMQLVLLTLGVAMMSFVFASVYTLINMLFQNRMISIAVCITALAVIAFAGAKIAARLEEPELTTYYEISFDGGAPEEQKRPNPNYVSGTQREIYLFLNDLLPGGQMLQLSSASPEHPVRLPLYSLALTVLITAAGAAVFNKKDIN